MTQLRLLIANRGEIALRILRAAEDLGWETVALHTEDEPAALHLRAATRVRRLEGVGAAPYLDATSLAAIAREEGCTHLHPGYGLLSESADLARACAEAGVVFVGPAPETLELFGDKARARALAQEAGVPCLSGTSGATSLEEARSFFDALPEGSAMLIKALSGGGGRGMRVVRKASALERAFERCRSEARRSFGNDAVYVERFLEQARHVEVQAVADTAGDVVVLGERECSIQRNHQKVVEVAPAPTLPADQRAALHDAALRLARAAQLQSLSTIEFLVAPGGEFFFIEANARLQVEHTVTEEVFGVDLVATQLRHAAGVPIADTGVAVAAERGPRGHAIQLRINMETITEAGLSIPAPAPITRFDLPTGPGVRVDTGGFVGLDPSPHFDSLLAKLIVHAPGTWQDALRRTRRALGEFHVVGPATGISFLRALLAREDFARNDVHTRFLEEHAGEILAAAPPAEPTSEEPGPVADPAAGQAGTRLDSDDPLAVLEHGRSSAGASRDTAAATIVDTPGEARVPAPLQGSILQVEVAVGDRVPAGQRLFVMEAMKMEHEILAPVGGEVIEVAVAVGDTVVEGHGLARLREEEVAGEGGGIATAVDPDHIRPDLDELRSRLAFGLDESRAEKVAKRHGRGQRTARENVADLCDDGSFLEYGALTMAAQRARRTVEDLMQNTPGDGLVGGVGSVNGTLFPEENARCAVLSYDYMVLAGTQGLRNHQKKDRLFEVAAEAKLPVVFFTEGGGGRPGDTDGSGVTGLDCLAFRYFAELSGEVPLIGITTGRCFAGNAALLGCCDVTIATVDSNIGMGGPAMIEGGGLGVFRPEDVGPSSVQSRNGVIDLLVQDEAEAVQVAKKYLAFFQGDLAGWEAADPRELRHVIPENRLRIYDVRRVIELIADRDSVLELRRGFGLGMITSFARIEGRPIGIVANNPAHLAGAIDAEAADKAARFLQLCDAFGIPVLMLCDTPGIMVGPAAEETALVRHAARLFVTGASVRVPLFTVVLRKGYGLGAQAMAGGSFRSSLFTVAWPTGEFGGMGLEGAVKLGFRRELEAIEDPAERKRAFEERVARAYEVGKAVNIASALEIDAVIDPAETRHWVSRGLASAPRQQGGGRRPFVDTW